MLFTVIFMAVLAVACLLAVKFGGFEERLTAAIFVLATGITPILMNHRYEMVELGVFALDVLLFGFLLRLAMTSDRYWPIWAAGFQLCALLVHVGAMAWNGMHPAAYAEMLAIWSHLVLYSFVAGILLESRTRTA